MKTQHFSIEVIDASGEISNAQVHCDVEYTADALNESRLCTVRLTWNSLDLTSTDGDFFRAFVGIRNKLESFHIRPLCYAASRNVYPSGMLRDMAKGLKAYKLALGKRTESADIVRIFDSGSDLDVVSVEDQERFHEQWFNSIKVLNEAEMINPSNDLEH
jgi:hypothetical protein